MCEKITYLTKSEAAKHLRRIQGMKRKKSASLPIRYYECNECGNWHLTSKEHFESKRNEPKPVELKHSKEWINLLARQRLRDDLFGEAPFERQMQKVMETITHNINIQCEVLDERFKHRLKKCRLSFNQKQNTLAQKLQTIKI